MIEHQHQVIGIAIAVRSLADGTNAGFVAFEGRVGEPMAGPGNDALGRFRKKPSGDGAALTTRCGVARSGSGPLRPGQRLPEIWSETLVAVTRWTTTAAWAGRKPSNTTSSSSRPSKWRRSAVTLIGPMWTALIVGWTLAVGRP